METSLPNTLRPNIVYPQTFVEARHYAKFKSMVYTKYIYLGQFVKKNIFPTGPKDCDFVVEFVFTDGTASEMDTFREVPSCSNVEVEKWNQDIKTIL